MKLGKTVLWNAVRPATDDHIQMRPTMLDLMDTVSTSMDSTAHAMCTAYALSVYDCVNSDILRSVN